MEKNDSQANEICVRGYDFKLQVSSREALPSLERTFPNAESLRLGDISKELLTVFDNCSIYKKIYLDVGPQRTDLRQAALDFVKKILSLARNIESFGSKNLRFLFHQYDRRSFLTDLSQHILLNVLALRSRESLYDFVIIFRESLPAMELLELINAIAGEGILEKSRYFSLGVLNTSDILIESPGINTVMERVFGVLNQKNAELLASLEDLSLAAITSTPAPKLPEIEKALFWRNPYLSKIISISVTFTSAIEDSFPHFCVFLKELSCLESLNILLLFAKTTYNLSLLYESLLAHRTNIKRLGLAYACIHAFKEVEEVESMSSKELALNALWETLAQLAYLNDLSVATYSWDVGEDFWSSALEFLGKKPRLVSLTFCYIPFFFLVPLANSKGNDFHGFFLQQEFLTKLDINLGVNIRGMNSLVKAVQRRSRLVVQTGAMQSHLKALFKRRRILLDILNFL